MTKGDKRRASAWAFSDRLTRLGTTTYQPRA